MDDHLFDGFTLLDRPQLRSGDINASPASAMSREARLQAFWDRLETGDRQQQEATLAALESAIEGRAVILHLSAEAAGPRLHAVRALLDGVVRVGRTLDRQRQEEAIAKLAEIMLPDELGVARGVLAADNLALRDAFMAKVPTFSGKEVGDRAGHSRSNPHATAARWKKAGDVFSVHHRGAEAFPAFQFKDDGRPRPIIRKTLIALPPQFTAWQRAFWFVSTNGWLNDDAPADMLDAEEAVLAAAAREAESVVG